MRAHTHTYIYIHTERERKNMLQIPGLHDPLRCCRIEHMGNMGMRDWSAQTLS